MPLFDMKCECGKTVEVLMSFPPSAKCPDCNKPMKQQISAPTPIAHYPLGHARHRRGKGGQYSHK